MIKVFQCPCAGAGKSFPGGREGPLQPLGLTAPTVWGDDHAAGRLLRGLGTVVDSKKMQT